MELTLEIVRRELQAEEPRYRQIAADLGQNALRYLRQIIASDDTGLAAKAAYLAGVIGSEEALPVVRQAAAHADVRVRVAAAAAAGMLPPDHANDVLVALVDDADAGVQKTALRSVPETPSSYLAGRVDALRSTSQSEAVQKASEATMARVKKQ
jgi:HEAT repeat protein